jgi:hypothetical protein
MLWFTIATLNTQFRLAGMSCLHTRPHANIPPSSFSFFGHLPLTSANQVHVDQQGTELYTHCIRVVFQLLNENLEQVHQHYKRYKQLKTKKC